MRGCTRANSWPPRPSMTSDWNTQALQIRASNWKVLGKLRLPHDPSLPLLEAANTVRSATDVCDRALSISATLAAACGFDPAIAASWLHSEHLSANLTREESDVLESSRGHAKPAFFPYVESLFAFAWILGLHDRLGPGDRCPNTLVSLFPRLDAGESSVSFRQSVSQRSNIEILRHADLYYCAHWAVRELEIGGKRSPVDETIVRNRRLSLDWVLGAGEWDAVPLDT